MLGVLVKIDNAAQGFERKFKIFSARLPCAKACNVERVGKAHFRADCRKMFTRPVFIRSRDTTLVYVT